MLFLCSMWQLYWMNILYNVCVFFLLCIALAYKGIDYNYCAVNLIKDGGEQVYIY